MTVRINKQKINLREKLAGVEEKVNFEEVIRGLGEYDGNVGIGTTNPSSMLHISGASPVITLTDTNTNADSSISADSGKGSLFINADINNEVTDSAILLNVDGAEKMRVDSNGNVGIGTTSPNISQGALGSTILTISASASDNTNKSSVLEFRGTRNSDDLVVSYIRSFNNSGTRPITDIQSIRGADDEGKLLFRTSDQDAMFIDSDGNVGIGTTSPGVKLDVRGGDDTYVAKFTSTYTDPGSANYKGIKIQAGMGNSGTAGNNKWIEFYNGNGSTLIGGIQNTSNTTVAFFSGSDRRIKKNINDTSIKGIDSIKALKLRSWDWNSTEPMTSVDIGLVADELEEVYPELISRQKIDGWEHCIGEGEEDLKTIPTESKITLTLIKAVQEQQQIIEDLKSRLETLEQQ